MSKEKCLPQYWFLHRWDEKPRFTLRQTGKLHSIPQNVLLSGRGQLWERKGRDDWGLTGDAVRLLGFPWTSGNLVVPLIDGEAYMRDLYGELKKLKAPAAVLLAGWQFTSRLGLMGPTSATLSTRLLEALREVMGKGCELRLLAWDNIKIPTSWWDQNNREFVKEVNEGSPDNSRVAYVDANLDGTFLSHHQKEVVIYRPMGECCAYVGGIDLGVDRWDTTEHKKARSSGTFIGWHDIQMKVRGDAAMQLWANFAERWDNNIAWLRQQKESYSLRPCTNFTWQPALLGSHHVQVLRTVTPVRSGFQERTMPYGERTVICGLQKAISRAECYIYIEEQFLWDCELADFVAQQMQSRPNLRLIVAMAAETELPLHYGLWHYHQRSKFFMTVMRVRKKEDIVFGGSSHVYPFGVYRDDGKAVYVHSKLVIIDDRYVSAGSANFAARSMWVDTELTLGIVDDALVMGRLGGNAAVVCKFAQDLRLGLWSEHLQRKIGTPDPLEALKLFPGTDDDWPTNEEEAEERARGHIRCYVNVPGKDLFVNKGWPNILDPCERHFTL
jgi:phosphatidylserine/phosphatidylglycerophosphate/cardiolipin synthase-like enzyme